MTWQSSDERKTQRDKELWEEGVEALYINWAIILEFNILLNTILDLSGFP